MSPALMALLCFGLCLVKKMESKTEFFPKPLLCALPRAMVLPGWNVTLRCWQPAQSSLQGLRFALMKVGTTEPIQSQSLGGTQADFSLPSVTAENTGSYNCLYYEMNAPHRMSEPSEILDLLVTGYLPKPSLLARPSPMMSPGGNVTLWCWRPPQADLQEVKFTLLKAGTLKPLQHQIPAEIQAAFSLLSVRAEDAGSYTCTYSETEPPGMMSKPSDALELLVTGSLPKPLLSALPGPVIAPGWHVTLQCQQPTWSSLWGLTFALFKAGVPEPIQQQRPVGAQAFFPILAVRAQDSGNYSCVYYHSMALQHKASEPSDPLEIRVTDSTQPGYTVHNLFHISLVGLVLVVIGVLLGSDWNSLRS
ncbi:T-cell-interacting, activating receptor on myeloid cells protein 1-like isoform X1 [Phascolarctos cinereus]|uniref:T-cell-interacting, activating receptor on myeloid cells protein 1-like isoform X2 n=1 Tax=Phascolarctos cinereus TaxID=38626 RepID=UPI000A283193|nr:T-cell-interacting, activating receptor on myeloid cells protein 1-like isoform X2 [Phascolarctos cinereus]